LRLPYNNRVATIAKEPQVNPKQPPKITHLEMGLEKPDILSWGGFLTLQRHRMRNVFQDGGASPWYELESVHPPFLDAVVLVLYAPQPGGDALVALRRGVRPSLVLRALDENLRQVDGGPLSGITWELPAGGVEPHDLEPGGAGLKGRACLEAWEEAGLTIQEDDLFPLGPPSFAAPAFCNERLHFLAARVDPDTAQPPPGDGHPMEQGGGMAFVALKEALEWCHKGRIMDIKSEVGLLRLAELLASESSQ
jgi:ADP-ribose pyrophosphatase